MLSWLDLFVESMMSSASKREDCYRLCPWYGINYVTSNVPREQIHHMEDALVFNENVNNEHCFVKRRRNQRKSGFSVGLGPAWLSAALTFVHSRNAIAVNLRKPEPITGEQSPEVIEWRINTSLAIDMVNYLFHLCSLTIVTIGLAVRRSMCCTKASKALDWRLVRPRCWRRAEGNVAVVLMISNNDSLHWCNRKLEKHVQAWNSNDIATTKHIAAQGPGRWYRKNYISNWHLSSRVCGKPDTMSSNYRLGFNYIFCAIKPPESEFVNLRWHWL